MATATLVTLVLLLIVSTIRTVMVIQTFNSLMDGYDETTGMFNDDTLNSLMFGYDETTGTFSDDTLYHEINNTSMLLTLSIIVYVLSGLALIFSGIFTWGRKCKAPRQMGTRYTCV